MLTSEASEYVEKYNSDNKQVEVVKDTATEFFVLGRPCVLPSTIDKDLRASKYLRSKMTIIHMIPCNHQISIDKIAGKDLSGLIPTIQYEGAIQEFKDACNAYGLNSNFGGIAMYTTEDTQASDTITHNRQGENLFQGLANKINDTFSPLYNAASSLGLSGNTNAEGAIGSLSDFLGSSVSGLAGVAGANDNLKNTLETVVGGLGRKITDAALNGYRYSFPTFWSDCSYDPNLSSVIKLVSPYGHPDAVRKFIIEPLMYLMILASPKTKDGMSYGRPSSLSVSAYGMAYLPLACVKSITLRRGTSYSVYSQPLEIEVNIQFQPIVSGFAAYGVDKVNGANVSNADSETASKSSEFITNSGRVDNAFSPTINTLENIVQSLRPIYPAAKMETHVYFGKNADTDERVEYVSNKGVSNIFTSSSSSDSNLFNSFSNNNSFSSSSIPYYGIVSDIENEIKKADTYVDTFVQNVKYQKAQIENSVVKFQDNVDTYVTLYDDVKERVENLNSQNALNTVNYILDKGPIQNISSNFSSYVNRDSLLSGAMGVGSDLKSIGSDTISYLGDLMDIPDTYDTVDFTKYYNIDVKSLDLDFDFF